MLSFLFFLKWCQNSLISGFPQEKQKQTPTFRVQMSFCLNLLSLHTPARVRYPCLLHQPKPRAPKEQKLVWQLVTGEGFSSTTFHSVWYKQSLPDGSLQGRRGRGRFVTWCSGIADNMTPRCAARVTIKPIIRFCCFLKSKNQMWEYSKKGQLTTCLGIPIYRSTWESIFL